MQQFTVFCILSSMAIAALAAPSPQGYGSNSKSEVYHEQDTAGYGKYRFGYKVSDPYTYNQQSRQEEKDEEGVVRGSYSLVEPDGNLRTVYYIADKFGFRAFVKNSNKPSSSHGDHAVYDNTPYDGAHGSYNQYRK